LKGVARTTIREEDGTYRFAGLLPGRYGLTAELPGRTLLASV